MRRICYILAIFLWFIKFIVNVNNKKIFIIKKYFYKKDLTKV